METRFEEYTSTVKVIIHLTGSLCRILHLRVMSQCMQGAILGAEFCANQGFRGCMVKEGCKHKVAVIQL